MLNTWRVTPMCQRCKHKILHFLNTNHAIQVCVLFLSIFVNVIRQLWMRPRTFKHKYTIKITLYIEVWLTDLSLETLLARFSAISLFSASSMSSTAPRPVNYTTFTVFMLMFFTWSTPTWFHIWPLSVSSLLALATSTIYVIFIPERQDTM